MDEAAGLPGVDGLQAVVLHFAHAHERRGNFLSETQETVAETDGKPRRPALLREALAVDVVLTVDARLLGRDVKDIF